MIKNTGSIETAQTAPLLIPLWVISLEVITLEASLQMIETIFRAMEEVLAVEELQVVGKTTYLNYEAIVRQRIQ